MGVVFASRLEAWRKIEFVVKFVNKIVCEIRESGTVERPVRPLPQA